MNWTGADAQPRPRRIIGLTPLIDVVFILLVFFMLVTSLEQWQPLPLQLGSDAATNTSTSPHDNIRIAIDNDGTLRLDGSPVAPELLRQRLEQRRSDGGHAQPIEVAPDPETSLQAILIAVDAARLAGFDTLSIRRISP